LAVAVAEKSTKTALTKTGGALAGFTHSLQPYTGCAFGVGCGLYCYVPSLPVHQYHSGGLAWGDYVYPKENIATVLAEELAQRARRGTLSGLRIFMSSATDPYQPLERKFGLSRACLEVFQHYPPGLLVIQTRSPLVRRDYGLMAGLGSRLWLSMTIETDSDALVRELTPNVPSISGRKRAVEAAKAAGLQVQVALSPMLPLAQPERFMDWLAATADRIVVDTFIGGDGSGGRRTAVTRVPALWQALGYGDWRDETPARDFYQALLTRLGPARVGWSIEGFNTIAKSPLSEKGAQLALPVE
jgi:DNA repair photolyase